MRLQTDYVLAFFQVPGYENIGRQDSFDSQNSDDILQTPQINKRKVTLKVL